MKLHSVPHVVAFAVAEKIVRKNVGFKVGLEPRVSRHAVHAERIGEMRERLTSGQAEEELRDDERLPSISPSSRIFATLFPATIVGFLVPVLK